MASGIRLTDLELLSAFLDDELSSRERAALEARLAAEPALQAELDELRRTVQILRAAPPLTPPRSFMLDPAIYRRRAPWWLRYGAFRLAGALGTAAAVMLIVLGVVSMSRPLPRGTPQGIAYQATQPVSDLVMLTATSTPLAATASQGEGGAESAAAPAAALQVTATPERTLVRPSPTLLGTATAQLDRGTEPPNTSTSIGRDKGSVTLIAAAPPVALPSTPTAAALALGVVATPAAENLGSTKDEATMNSRRADETHVPTAPAPAGGPADGAGFMTAPSATALAMEQPAQTTSVAKSSEATGPMMANAPTAAPTLTSSPSPAPRSTVNPTPRPTATPSGTPVPSATPAPSRTVTPVPTGTMTPSRTVTPPATEITALPQSLDPTARLLLVLGIALLIISLLVFGIGWARSRL